MTKILLTTGNGERDSARQAHNRATNRSPKALASGQNQQVPQAHTSSPAAVHMKPSQDERGTSHSLRINES